MPGKNSVSDVLADAAKIVDVWNTNPEFKMGSITLDSFKASMTAVQSASGTVESKRTELNGLITNRDVKTSSLNDLVSRARSGVRASFGPDSTEYEQVGGTRRSERKTPTRKTKVTTPTT